MIFLSTLGLALAQRMISQAVTKWGLMQPPHDGWIFHDTLHPAVLPLTNSSLISNAFVSLEQTQLFLYCVKPLTLRCVFLCLVNNPKAGEACVQMIPEEGDTRLPERNLLCDLQTRKCYWPPWLSPF